MNTKHAPGKWKIDGKKTSLNNYKISSDGVSICQVFTSNTHSEANAKLIAAAPIMLDELMHVVNRLAILEGSTPFQRSFIAGLRDHVKAVIEQATAQEPKEATKPILDSQI